jgi:outer membrane protein, heavy metal efflux system
MQREAAALRAAKEILQLLIAGASARYTTGDGDLAMPAELQIERSRLEGQLDDLAVERSEAVARLNALLDRPAETPIHAVDPLPPLGMRIPEDEAERTALAAHAVEHAPEVRMARAEVEAATRRLHAARLARWPDLVVGGEYGYRREIDPMVTARVGVELPLWKGKKQEAEVRAAEHDLRAAEEELRGAEARVRSEAASMLLRLAVSDRQVRRYVEEILPTSSLVIEARRTAYETGRGGARELLEATRMLLMAESVAARRQADRYEAMAQWESMAGASSGTEGESR